MSNNIKEFESFNEQFKLYQDNVPYEEMVERKVAFDSELELTPVSMLDPEQIILQSAEISKKSFYYTNIYESQKRVLQTVEDEFNMWYAKVYCEIDSEKETAIDKHGKALFDDEGKAVMIAVKRNETQKEMTLKTRYSKEYNLFYERVKQEKYKLGLIAGVKKSLESFSYKLNNINEYAKEVQA